MPRGETQRRKASKRTATRQKPARRTKAAATSRRTKATDSKPARRTKAAAEPATPRGLVMRAEAAEHFGVSPLRINKWVADGAPTARRGKRGQPALYDLAQLEAWRAAKRDASDSGISLEQERAKLAGRQREKIELEMAVRRGELVERDEVIRVGQTLVRAALTRLQQIPRQATQIGLLTREREPDLRRMIHDACAELSGLETMQQAESVADDEGGA